MLNQMGSAGGGGVETVVAIMVAVVVPKICQWSICGSLNLQPFYLMESLFPFSKAGIFQAAHFSFTFIYT